MAKVPKMEIEDWQTAYDASKNEQEREQALKDYGDAKLRNAARREEYMLERAVERAEKRRAQRKKVAKNFKKATQKVPTVMGRMWLNLKNFFQRTK